MTRRERRALGRFAADLQRRQLVKDFETMLLAGDAANSKAPLVFFGGSSRLCATASLYSVLAAPLMVSTRTSPRLCKLTFL